MDNVLALRVKKQGHVKGYTALLVVCAAIFVFVGIMAFSSSVGLGIGMIAFALVSLAGIPFVFMNSKKIQLQNSYPAEAVVVKNEKLYIVEANEIEILPESIKKVYGVQDTTRVLYATVYSSTGTLCIHTDSQKYKIKQIADVEAAAEKINKWLEEIKK